MHSICTAFDQLLIPIRSLFVEKFWTEINVDFMNVKDVVNRITNDVTSVVSCFCFV